LSLVVLKKGCFSLFVRSFCLFFGLTIFTEKVTITRANITVGLHFDIFPSRKDGKPARSGSQTLIKVIILESEHDQLVGHDMIVRDLPRQTIVIDGKLFQAAIANGNIGKGKAPTKLIVVQVQVPEADRALAKVGGKLAGQLIVPEIQVKETTPSKIRRNGTCQLIALQIDVIYI
jgi:hypothetical protein